MHVLKDKVDVEFAASDSNWIPDVMLSKRAAQVPVAEIHKSLEIKDKEREERTFVLIVTLHIFGIVTKETTTSLIESALYSPS